MGSRKIGSPFFISPEIADHYDVTFALPAGKRKMFAVFGPGSRLS